MDNILFPHWELKQENVVQIVLKINWRGTVFGFNYHNISKNRFLNFFFHEYTHKEAGLTASRLMSLVYA